MLKYAKELFDITHEEGMARNIIAMLFERNETDINAYAPYINVLSNSVNPDYCMAVASAMLRLSAFGNCFSGWEHIFLEKVLKTVREFFAFIRKRYCSGCYFFANFVLRPEKCRSNPLRKLGGFCSLLYRNEV